MKIRVKEHAGLHVVIATDGNVTAIRHYRIAEAAEICKGTMRAAHRAKLEAAKPKRRYLR